MDAEEKRPQKGWLRSIFKCLKRTLLLGLALVLIAIGFLLTTGWPFGWAIRLASDQEVVPGLAWSCANGRLKADWDGELRVEMGGFTFGNVGAPALADLEAVTVEWSSGGLRSGSIAPEQIKVKGLKVTPRLNEEGLLVFVELPERGEPEEEVDELNEPIHLENLPRFLFPAEGRPLLILVEGFELLLPQEFGGPLRRALTDLEIEVSRNLDRLQITSVLRETLNESTEAIFEGGTQLVFDLGTGLVTVRNEYDLKFEYAESVVAEYGLRKPQGILKLESDIAGNVLELGKWKVTGSILWEGVKVDMDGLVLDLVDIPIRQDYELNTEGIGKPKSLDWSMATRIGTDLLTNELSGLFDLESLKGQLKTRLEVSGLEALLARIPFELPGVRGGIEISGHAAYDVALLEIETMGIHFESTPIDVVLSEELQLALPRMVNELEGSGRWVEGDQAYGLLNTVSKVFFTNGEIAETRLKVDLAAVSQVVSLNLESEGWDLDALKGIANQGVDLEAEGLIGLQVDLGYGLKEATLRHAQFDFDLEGIHLWAKTYLKKSLVIPTTSFHGQVGANFENGTVSPFVFSAGPLSIRSDGFSWAQEAGRTQGKGSLEMGGMKGSFLREWVVDELLGELPLNDDELAEIGIVDSRVEFDIQGADGALPVVDLLIHTGAELNEGGVEGIVRGHFDPNTEKWDIGIEVPDFVQAQWNLAVLKRFPSPLLNAPVTAWFSAKGQLPDQIKEARWALEVKEGEVDFGDLLKDWLIKPLPVTYFRVAGAMDEGVKKLKLDSLEFVSGRGVLAFNRGELQKPDSFIVQNGTPAKVDLQFELRDWYLGDFVSLLSPDALELLQLKGRDLERVGLEHFTLDTQLTIAQEPAGIRLLSLAGETNAAFLVGGALVPLDIELSFDQGRSVLSALTRVTAFQPNLIDLDYLKEHLPIGMESLAIPISCEIKLEAGIPVPGEDAVEPPVAELKFMAGPGEIAANSFMRVATPLKEVSMTGRIRVDALQLEAFRIFADFGGPQFLLDEIELKLGTDGAPMEGQMRLLATDWDIGWLHARIPDAIGETIIPSEVLAGQFGGKVDVFDLRATFALDLEHPGPSALKVFSLKMESGDFEATVPGYPRVYMHSLRAEGDAGKVVVMITDAGVDGVVMSRTQVEISEPLTALPEGSVALNIRGDLGRLKGLLESWTLRPEGIDLSLIEGLGGDFSFDLEASAPLSAETNPESIQSHFGFNLIVDQIPFLPEGVRIGHLDTHIEGSVQEGQAVVLGKGRLGEVAFDDYAAGDLPFEWNVHSDFEQLKAKGLFDLSTMELKVVDLGWRKESGKPASFSLGIELPDFPEEGEGLHLGYALGATGLAFESIRGHGWVEIDQGIENGYGGLRKLELAQLELDATDLNAMLLVGEKGDLDLRIGSRHIDVAEILRRFEPMVAHLQHELIETRKLAEKKEDSPLDTKEAEAVEVDDSSPEELDSPLAGLPNMKLHVLFPELYMGGAEYLRQFEIRTELEESLPVYLKFGFNYGNDLWAVDLGKENRNGGAQDWRFELTNIGNLVNTLLQPLLELSAETCPEGSELALLRDLPLSVSGGHLRLSGDVQLDMAQVAVDGSMEMSGLVFEKEIPFLSRIAGLVDKQVYLEVPFHRFDIERFHYDPQLAEVKALYIDGPVDISFEGITVDLIESQMLAKGKVFGLCFEVAGLLDDLGFYLCDDMPGVGVLTAEDEFVW